MAEPWSGQYENQFEKDFYMALNLFRNQPGKCTKFIKDLKNLMQEFKKEKGFIDELCLYLTSLKEQNQIRFDDNATKACRQNNKKKIAENEEVPSKSGNLEEYT